MPEAKTSGKVRTIKATPREKLLALLRGGPEGVKAWNARKFADRRRAGPYLQADLSGADLRGADLASPFTEEEKGLVFQEAVFDRATLAGATLDQSNFSQARFQGCDCRQVRMRGAICRFACFDGAGLQQGRIRGTLFNNATFAGADLSGADVSYANLCDADLATAILTDVKFDHTLFSKATRFPPGFEPGAGLKLVEAVAIAPHARPQPGSDAGTPLSHGRFLKQLERVVDPGRLGRALEMLRAERFHLFSQVEEAAVVGVVKSQREPDLVYSCGLDRDGNFSCCSQHLAECLGLGGALCKHILVLLVGLARTGNIDPEVVLGWVEASLRKKNHLDAERASTVLLRYKGAEAGEVDWRPTETIPEDFYAF